MSSFTQYLRLFLIAAMVLSPVQHLFAAQADDSTAVIAMAATGVVAHDVAHNGAPKMGMPEMLDNDCSEHGKGGNCQGSNQCGSCPFPLEISQISPKRAELNTQIQFAISDVSLNSADLSPDYRPPRYS